jgi:cysteine desulfurase
MQTLIEFLTYLRGDGLLSLLAGHYAWPGSPDPFGIDSAVHMADVLQELEPGTVDAHIFIDDIAASAMCSAAPCDTGTTTRQKLNPLTGSGLEPWISNHLPAIERAAISQHSSWLEQAHHLAQFLGTLNQADDSPSTITNLQVPNRYDGINSWLADVEVLLYLTSKPSFRPLLLSYETERRLPRVLFERTITNGASRMLHRMQKSELRTNLRVSTDDDGRRLYWVQDERGNRIELRNETTQRGGMQASNKCSAILSQLFFYACRALNGVLTPRPSLSVFYMIPSYDRERLRDGIKAFFEIYKELDPWFGVRQISLASAFYTYPDRSEMCCEVYSVGPKSTHLSVATHRILTPASRRFRATPVPGSGSRGRERIYVDHNATTPLDPRVLKKMMPFMTEAFGNASSAHSFGWEAELAIAEARQQVAELINAEPDEIFFTSGATESNNWFLKQWVNRDSVKIITSALEHKAVLEPLEYLRQNNVAVAYLPFDHSGQIDLEAIESDILRPDTIITLMSVNNEIHSLLDLTVLGALSNEMGAIFHTDAAQALGKVPINVRRMGIHAMSMSGHKIYGPKGIGALFVTKTLQKRLSPLLSGGGQEHGLRSGTLATSLIIGFGEACAIAREQMEPEAQRLYGLSELFLSRLNSQGVSYRLIGPHHVRQRQPGSLSMMIAGLEASKLSELLPEIALSRGSACNSLEARSHVLKAMNLSPDEESSSLRLSFGRYNDASQALYIADRIADVLTIPKLRAGRVMMRA